jgi:DNA-binding MarR family transcriptional regulator
MASAPRIDTGTLTSEVSIAAARLHRRLIAERAVDELSDTQSAVLSAITKNGPRTQRELSDLQRVTAPSMTQAVNSLAALGYVTREPDPSDGRKVLVTPTKRGEEVAAEGRRRHRTWLAGHLDSLSAAERDTLQKAAVILRGIADS